MLLQLVGITWREVSSEYTINILLNALDDTSYHGNNTNFISAPETIGLYIVG